MEEHKPRILIVEDEDAIRLTLRDYLCNKGYDVAVASDGVGAIKQLLDNDIDIIISDYRMDVLGGEYWIRFLERFCAKKGVLITLGFLKPDFRIPFTVVYKPFDYSELETHIPIPALLRRHAFACLVQAGRYLIHYLREVTFEGSGNSMSRRTPQCLTAP